MEDRSRLMYGWLKEGKKTMVEKIEKGNIKWEDYIMSEQFTISSIDLALLLKEKKIPSVFLSATTTPLFLTNKTKNELIVYGLENDLKNGCLYFLIPTVVKNDAEQNIKWIECDNQTKIEWEKIQSCEGKKRIQDSNTFTLSDLPATHTTIQNTSKRNNIKKAGHGKYYNKTVRIHYM